MKNFQISDDGQALTAGAASSTTALAGAAVRVGSAPDVMIHNPGPLAIRVRAGAADVVATAQSVLVLPGSVQTFAKGSATHLAAVTDSGASQPFTVWLGEGSLGGGGGGGGGAGAAGDVIVGGSGLHVQMTREDAPAAYNQQFGMLLAGHVWQYKIVTSDPTGLNIANGPAILGGIYLISAGTMAAVYDSATASGNVLIPSTTATVHFNGAGVVCPNGITCDWTSGTWLVLYRATA